MTRREECLNLEHLRKGGKLFILSVCGKGDREFEEFVAQERGQGLRPQPGIAFGMRGEWPQGGSGLARRKQRIHRERGGQGMEPRKKPEKDGSEKGRRGGCRERMARAKSTRTEVSWGPQLGLRVAGRGGGRRRGALGAGVGCLSQGSCQRACAWAAAGGGGRAGGL